MARNIYGLKFRNFTIVFLNKCFFGQVKVILNKITSQNNASILVLLKKWNHLACLKMTFICPKPKRYLSKKVFVQKWLSPLLLSMSCHVPLTSNVIHYTLTLPMLFICSLSFLYVQIKWYKVLKYSRRSNLKKINQILGIKID